MSAYELVLAVVCGVLMGLGGLAFLVAGAWSLAAELKMGARARGTVVDSQLDHEGEKWPVVVFTTDQGSRQEFVGASAMGKSGPWVSQSVPVRYNLSEPSSARIATVRGSFLGSCLGIVVGVLSLGLYVWAVLDIA